MSSLIANALCFAAQMHAEQTDKNGQPYIWHPIRVAQGLKNAGYAETYQAVGLLHDTVEDTETTPEELTETFGAEISDIVMEVTDDKSLEKEVRKQAQIDHAQHLSRQARAVKLADKICNLGDVVESPPAWPLERRQQYFDWAKNVIDGLRGEWSELEAEFDRRYKSRPTQ